MLLYKIEPSRGAQTAVTPVQRLTPDLPESSGVSACAVMCIEQFDTELESMLVFAQEHGAVRGWDMRCRTVSWNLRAVPPWLGVPNCVALGGDGHSVVVGTLGGGLLLYDLRFLAPFRHWQVSSGAAVLAMRSAEFGASPCVFVGLGSHCNEVALFDVVKGSCSTLFLTEPIGDKRRDAVSVPTLLPMDLSSSSASSVGRESLQQGLLAGRKAKGSVRALWLPSRGAQTYLLSAGTDRKVRHWSLDPEHHTAQAYVITPPELQGADKSRGRTTYTSNYLGDVFVVQEEKAPVRADTTGSWAQAPKAPDSEEQTKGPNPNHRDAILDMCEISLQHEILVTAGRDGLVKLWR